jgi:hypothetical protein
MLPNARVKFNVIYFNFLEQLYSLLSNQTLMTLENPLFHNDDPFSPPPEKQKELHDINDGSLYYQAYHRYVKNPFRDILCRLILFVDGTHLSANGKLTLEPVTMTVSILKKGARRLPYAWRTLGFINKLANICYPKRKDYTVSSNRAADYHYILDVIFASLWEAQSSGGIWWDLWYQGQTHRVCLKVPIFFVICDL